MAECVVRIIKGTESSALGAGQAHLQTARGLCKAFPVCARSRRKVPQQLAMELSHEVFTVNAVLGSNEGHDAEM